MKYILGVDPGQSGGLAFLYPTNVLTVEKMPETETDLVELIEEWAPKLDYAVIERVSAMPGQGVHSMFVFGQHNGLLRGILASFKIERHFVTPQKWQRQLGIPSRGQKTKTQHKNLLKGHAQELFPKTHLTLATCDAALIAFWASRFLFSNK